MTDFVHESPKDPNKASAPREEKPTTERERMKKVYTYVAVLFTVAFLLILWTFLMNQRSSQAIRDEIKSGNSALQSTLEENDTLEARARELEAQLAEAEADRDALSCAHLTGSSRSKTTAAPRSLTRRRRTSAPLKRKAPRKIFPQRRCAPPSPATTPPPPPHAIRPSWKSSSLTA